MGLFDSLASQALTSLVGGQQGALLDTVMGLVGNSQAGGLPGLVKAFEGQGLGSVVSSWIGTGQNLPISAEQIQSVLGSEHIQGIAQKLGFSPEEASNKLAQFLPQIIDKLTPNGTLPETPSSSNDVMSVLKGLL